MSEHDDGLHYKLTMCDFGTGELIMIIKHVIQ